MRVVDQKLMNDLIWPYQSSCANNNRSLLTLQDGQEQGLRPISVTVASGIATSGPVGHMPWHGLTSLAVLIITDITRWTGAGIAAYFSNCCQWHSHIRACGAHALASMHPSEMEFDTFPPLQSLG